jgi:hypothetical protein
MKTTELRIGNLVYGLNDENHSKKEVDKIAVINLVGWETMNGKTGIQEIELSEQWLIDNAGFKKDDCYGVFKYLKKHEYDTDKLSFRDDEGFMCLHVMQYRSLLKHIKVVHLFQNLWNSLTGVECALSST